MMFGVVLHALGRYQVDACCVDGVFLLDTVGAGEAWCQCRLGGRQGDQHPISLLLTDLLPGPPLAEPSWRPSGREPQEDTPWQA